MKTYLLILSIVMTIILQSCASNQSKGDETTFWVAGYKTEASAGAGKVSTLLINKSEDYHTGEWENFYAPIKGFTFEPGVLKRITVTQKQLDASKVPADASSIEYTLKKELKKIDDNSAFLNGQWILVKINQRPINKMAEIPTLNIQLRDKTFSGLDGCNNHSGDITELTDKKIILDSKVATMRACLDKGNLSSEYKPALAEVRSYTVTNKELKLYNEKGDNTLMYIRK